MNVQLIYDVGGHVGEDTDFYLRKGFKVVTVEANPVLAKGLRDKFRSNLSDGNLVVVDSAIAKDAGEIDFYVNECFSVWGTIRSDWAERNVFKDSPSKPIKVKAIRFAELLGTYGVPYYLKIDIEGADVLCLEGLAERSDRPRFVSIESEKKSWHALLYEFEIFKRLGYSRFKIVNQERIDQQKPPYPATEGHYIEYRFELGSSGLFGEELPGKWLTARQAIWRYRFIFLRYRLIGDFGIVRKPLRVLGFRKSSARTSKAHSAESGNGKRWYSAAVRCIRGALKPSWYDTHATV